MNRAYATLLGSLALVVFVSTLGSPACMKGRGRKRIKLKKLSAASKTPACRQAVTAALEGLRKHLGLGLKLTKQDVQRIMDSGKMDRGYGRDGIRHGVWFGLIHQKGKCSLAVYRTSQSRPGHYTSNTGIHAAISMSACQCP